jgi:hypothetical protein
MVVETSTERENPQFMRQPPEQGFLLVGVDGLEPPTSAL